MPVLILWSVSRTASLMYTVWVGWTQLDLQAYTPAFSRPRNCAHSLLKVCPLFSTHAFSRAVVSFPSFSGRAFSASPHHYLLVTAVLQRITPKRWNNVVLIRVCAQNNLSYDSNKDIGVIDNMCLLCCIFGWFSYMFLFLMFDCINNNALEFIFFVFLAVLKYDY